MQNLRLLGGDYLVNSLKQTVRMGGINKLVLETRLAGKQSQFYLSGRLFPSARVKLM